jgi:hypothetical protein
LFISFNGIEKVRISEKATNIGKLEDVNPFSTPGRRLHK